MQQPAEPPSQGVLARIDAFDRALSARIVARPDVTGQRRLWLRAVHRCSQAGSYGIGWVVLFAILVTAMEGRRLALVASACVLGTLVANTGIKLVVRRPRPRHNLVGVGPATYSMPSAHTSMAVVGAAAMTLVAPVLAPLWWAIAIALAGSRLVLGMHYVLDVFAGLAFGALVSWLVALPLLRAAGAG